MPGGERRIDLEVDQSPHSIERIAKDEASPLDGAKQVADHGEGAAFDPGKVDCGAAGLIDAALNFGRVEAGVDFGVDPYQLPRGSQIVET